MIKINLQNIEELLFLNQDVMNLLPEYKMIYSQWKLSRQFPDLRKDRSKWMMDLLNALTPKHIAILEEYFKDKIQITKLNYHLVKNFESSLENLEDDLNKADFSEFENFTFNRKGSDVYVCFWK